MKTLGLLLKLQLLQMISSFSKSMRAKKNAPSAVGIAVLALLIVFLAACFMFMFFSCKQSYTGLSLSPFPSL
jgi:hypothetical protein